MDWEIVKNIYNKFNVHDDKEKFKQIENEIDKRINESTEIKIDELPEPTEPQIYGSREFHIDEQTEFQINESMKFCTDEPTEHTFICDNKNYCRIISDFFDLLPNENKLFCIKVLQINDFDIKKAIAWLVIDNYKISKIRRKLRKKIDRLNKN